MEYIFESLWLWGDGLEFRGWKRVDFLLHGFWISNDNAAGWFCSRLRTVDGWLFGNVALLFRNELGQWDGADGWLKNSWHPVC